VSGRASVSNPRCSSTGGSHSSAHKPPIHPFPPMPLAGVLSEAQHLGETQTLEARLSVRHPWCWLMLLRVRRGLPAVNGPMQDLQAAQQLTRAVHAAPNAPLSVDGRRHGQQHCDTNGAIAGGSIAARCSSNALLPSPDTRAQRRRQERRGGGLAMTVTATLECGCKQLSGEGC
jgi:hypothetical protein